MKRFFLSISIILIGISSALAQTPVYLGTASKSDNYIYEDGILDDGTRFIICSMFHAGNYMISLCEFVNEEGDYWYSLAVESRSFIPHNGLIAFFFKDQDQHPPIIIGQQVSKSTVKSKRAVRTKPVFIFGFGRGWGHNHIAFTTRETTKESEIFFGMYDLTEEELQTIINNDLKLIRISTRSKYDELNRGIAKRVSSDLAESKEYLDARAALSQNTILEGLTE